MVWIPKILFVSLWYKKLKNKGYDRYITPLSKIRDDDGRRERY